MQTHDTRQQFEAVLGSCRRLFEQKLHDYGTAWRVMSPPTLTDQLYIKAARIRTLLRTGEAKVDEGITPEFTAIVNYSLIALIQLSLPLADTEDLEPEKALELYDERADKALKLMLAKNHDYGEAWRAMRVASLADIIMMKIFRTKQIEDLDGATLVSEGVAANYMDMMNYAIFALIKLGGGE